MSFEIPAVLIRVILIHSESVLVNLYATLNHEIE